MKTITKNISTQLIMLAVVLGVLSTEGAKAGDRASALYVSVGTNGSYYSSGSSTIGYDADGLIPAGWQIDKEFLRRKGAGDLLKVTTTKARWTGQNYVAFVLVEWGNLKGTAIAGPSNWNGSVTVDDGAAYVSKTIGFEQPVRGGRHGRLQLTPKQSKKLAKLQAELDEELAEAEDEYQEEVDEAYDEIRNPTKLARKLAKIEQEYAEEVADAQDEYEEELAKLLADAQANNFTPGDALIATNDDEKVKWQASVNGGTDGVLIKLVMDDDDEDVVVKAGGLKISFELKGETVAPVVIVGKPGPIAHGGYYGRHGSTYGRHTSTYGRHGRSYGGQGTYYGGNRSYGRSTRYYTPPQPRRSLRRYHHQPRRHRYHDQRRDRGSTTVRRQVTRGRSTGYTDPGRGRRDGSFARGPRSGRHGSPGGRDGGSRRRRR